MAISDPSFPALHIRPEQGWLNDPNGVCLIDGRYHVFFQFNPDEPVHDAVRWGHASSTDLIEWRYHPIALFNRPGSIDARGCWTGCITDDHGTPTAVYSAVTESAEDAQIALARSDRQLISWQQSEEGVVGPPQLPGVSEARDPYVFSTGGKRYAIQGAGSHDGNPLILLYGCDDLEQWEDLGTLLDSRNPIAREVLAADIWECPNLFQIGGRWILIISRWEQGRLSDSCYLVGDLEPSGSGLRFVPTSGGVVDDGPSFYAPQVLPSTDRPLLWGWAREVGRTDAEVLEAGWSGALTFPRELSLNGEVLVSEPASELIKLRTSLLSAADPIEARAFEVRAPDGVRLELVDGASSRTVLAESGESTILVDGSVIEVFSPGRPPQTLRAYPRAGSRWRIDASGDAHIHELALPAH